MRGGIKNVDICSLLRGINKKEEYLERGNVVEAGNEFEGGNISEHSVNK